MTETLLVISILVNVIVIRNYTKLDFKYRELIGAFQLYEKEIMTYPPSKRMVQ
jgi:hypothetical protein